MDQVLLERDDTLGALLGAVEESAAGRGSVVLLSGGAGLGKTSVLRAFVRTAAARARVLLTSCDDLIAPRTLGPLRDAALDSDGPLADAFAEGRPVDGVFAAVMAELAAAPPTALVVEDVHWADDGTIDVLGYVARRIETIPAVLVLSFRDDELGPSHPLQRLLGTLAGRPVLRLALPPLSRAAVERLAASTGADADALHRVTGGNPFFVTEALASPADVVPATVVEAVLARVTRLGPACREALEQLSVVPSRIRFELAVELLGDRIDALGEAELAGVLEVSAQHLGFRHELARRAIERSLPALARRRLNARVLTALQREQRPDRASLMHFAVEAGDVETVLAVGPEAAREAARAGSHRQALAHLESVRPHLQRLGERERAAVLDDYGWELYNAHRFREAVDAGQAAAALYEQLGDSVAVAHCLVRVSRHLFMAGETVAAGECADRAVTILKPRGDSAALASASLQNGAILALTDEFERAAGTLEVARRLALGSGRGDLAALALNYLGVTSLERGDPDGLRLVRESVEVALSEGHHEAAARGYCNVAELLYRQGRLGELDACIAEGLPFARERGFWSHAYNLELHRCVLRLRRGDLDDALAGLRALVHGVEDPGMLFAYSVPWLGRALARRGDPAAGGMLAATWDGAQRQQLLLGVAYAGLASVEWAWLAGRPEIAERVAAALAPRLAHAGAAPFRAELARYLARAGLPAEPFDGCPEPWAAGLRGDWRAAADGWAIAGDPYEQALELSESGDARTVAEGLRILDAMDAVGAAARVRATLRAAGVPAGRGPRATTRANPAGLTERQLDVLELLSEGLTNAQIAERLVLSVRTVDHHVAAVLEKLGVPSRHDAAGAARRLGVGAGDAHAAGPAATTRR
jgi:DNA-binding CsgD family transcriptional regulator/tetratricopeptide (TPR) repeat protein